MLIGNAMMHNFWPLKQQEMLLSPFNVRKKEPFTLGFLFSMPAETFHGHGLRKDLAEKL